MVVFQSPKYTILCGKNAYCPKIIVAMCIENLLILLLFFAFFFLFSNHFPYFKTAPNGWKNSVRHNLSLNKCFEKIEKPAGSAQRKGCLWALNPSKAAKLEDEVQKWAKKDSAAIKRAMEYPGEYVDVYSTRCCIRF